MKRIKYITFIAGILCCLNSCRDYVEIEPVGNSRVLKYTSDYRGLANNYSNTEYIGGVYLLANDDAEISGDFQSQISDIWTNSYTWQPAIYNDGQGDSDWMNLYLAVYYSNVIINGVMDSENGSQAEKEEIIAEAYVNRAYSYLQLVNVYAPHYSEATAATQKGVPLLLTPDLFADLERSTVNEIYEQIISDLENALSYNIQDLPEFNVLPSKAATYALLARTYLYMGNYELALENAQNALNLQNGLINLAAIRLNPYDYPVLLENPEIIYSKKTQFSFKGASLSQSLLNSFKPEDARYDIYTAEGYNFWPTFEGRGFGIDIYSYSNGNNVGLSVPEMYLIAAESQVRLGNVASGLEQLNMLRSKRFNAGYDFEVTATTKEEALDLVIEERQKEFIGRGFRWFDQKRLNLEDRYKKTISREFLGATYTLEPGGDGYVFPIFQKYIDLNPELNN